MFGMQRIGDLAWAAGDMRARGFLLGATAGRTTLNGEGLQLEDGHSHLFSGVIPNCRSYDPTFSFEVAVILQDGMRRMVAEQEDCFYYLTLMNENYAHPDMPKGAEAGIIKGMYLLRDGDEPLAPALASMNEPADEPGKEAPEITDGARLVVRCPNVMLGYLKAEKPGVLQPPDGGWYDTGDIVAIEPDGFVTIKGRAKRFAKVAGEMVPLGAVEEFVNRVWPDSAHAVVAIPDDKRGEQVVLVTDLATAARPPLLAAARESGVPEMFVPRTIVKVAKLPILGTGKIDYVNAGRLALQQAQAS
jgi:acyl-CoA synthetase (AMP-forming)/AMP-acid ligase II